MSETLFTDFVQLLGVNVTGDFFTPILLIVIFIVLIALSARIPLEWTSIIVMPILITGMAIDSNFAPYLGVAMLYVASIATKAFLLNR